MRVALAEPHVEVEVIRLLRPQHAGKRLTHDEPGVLAGVGRRDRVVELVGLAPAHREVAVGVCERLGERVGRVPCQTHQERGLLTPGNRRDDVGRCLGSLAGRVHGRGAVDHVIVDAVLRVRRRGLGAPEARVVRLVLAEQQLGAALGVQIEGAELRVLRLHRGLPGVDPSDPGLRVERGP